MKAAYTVTNFVYGLNGQLLGEYDATNSAMSQEFIYLGDMPVAVIAQDKVYYLHSDHLGTPREVSDPDSNTVVWRWDSDPFGRTAANEDPDGDGNSFTLNLRFPGQYYDSETGLHYNYFRYYDPKTGRYITSDPIGLKGGLNTYGYVGGNPLNAIDPSGLREQPGDGGGGPGQSCPLISSTRVVVTKHGLQVYLCIYNCNESCPGSFENIRIKVEWSVAGQKGCSESYWPDIED